MSGSMRASICAGAAGRRCDLTVSQHSPKRHWTMAQCANTPRTFQSSIAGGKVRLMPNSVSIRVGRCIVAGALAVIAGCEMTSHRVGQSASVQFGVVQRADEVTLDSNAAQGALLGGTIGLLASGRGSPVQGAATGAVVGAAGAAATEGNRTGTQYTVQMADGSSTRIVSDQREIKVNDCVAIERVGSRANIRRASSDYCDPANAAAVSAVSEANESEALHCQTAKEELAAAQDAQAVDLAIRKVELLCDD